MPHLKDGTHVNDIRLDRLPEFDPRSRQYPIREVITLTQPVTKMWHAPAGTPVLDQGPDGACTGFGTTNELLYNPVPIPGLTNTYAKQTIYWGAQHRDPWPGGSYPGASPFYEGSTVLAAVKTAKSIGYYGVIRWAFGEPDLALAISMGPAILGLNWWTNMFHPDAHGFLHPSGQIEGGHCILCVGIDVEHGFYTVHNSWGASWGQGGNAKISRANMASLLADQGEACIPVTRFAPAP